MAESSLAEQRRTLKLWLSTIRLEMPDIIAKCAWCNEFLISGYDMHEAIVTRGNVRGNKELLPLIMVSQNCVLVHHGDCHQKIATKQGRRKAIAHLIQWEEFENIIYWLENLDTHMTTSFACEAIRLVEEVNDEL